MDREKQLRFWMVWSPQGGAPTYKHLTGAETDQVADRLSQNHAGRTFYALKAVGGCRFEKPEVRSFKMRPRPFDDGMQF